MISKPHLSIPIVECGEPLVAIPADRFALFQPHPYADLGAPYGDLSPFFLRAEVLERLGQAQAVLQQQHPHWHFHIFDAYRPLPVQQFMVDYTFRQLAQEQGLDPQALSPQQTTDLEQQVHQFWAEPVTNPHTPPPHSTGAAVDLILRDHQGQAIPMGSPIDECSPRSYPDHFANAADSLSQTYHQNRLALRQAMEAAGFQNHPYEWWHFSQGDQLWAWLEHQQGRAGAIARYGRVEAA